MLWDKALPRPSERSSDSSSSAPLRPRFRFRLRRVREDGLTERPPFGFGQSQQCCSTHRGTSPGSKESVAKLPGSPHCTHLCTLLRYLPLPLRLRLQRRIGTALQVLSPP